METSRRQTLITLLGAPFAAVQAIGGDAASEKLSAYFERLRKPNGGYSFELDSVAHISPTFGVVGSCQLLGLTLPDKAKIAEFARSVYPVPARRRTERPLWRLDFEQVQTLLWLGQPIDSFRQIASTWTQPSDFTKTYEFGGNPVFQHQVMAIRVRKLLGLEPTDAWRNYLIARRRPNHTFNNTPAADSSDGHIVNTLWGLWAVEDLGLEMASTSALAEWVHSCRLSSGGYTWSPGASLGAVDDIFYTWAALRILNAIHVEPKLKRKTAEWVRSLETSEGAFQDRPGGEPNPVATFYCLDSLRLLGDTTSKNVTRAVRAQRMPVPKNAGIYSIQIEAPGGGSPIEAAHIAKRFGIHIWAAKNSPAGWLQAAQKAANEIKADVLFATGDEEYGTFVQLPGLGTYSHLVDLVAPPESSFGEPMPKKQFPYPWAEFRDTRIKALRSARGSMIWQFNENEELTRILLDEAVEKGTYGSIASFHFGNENFLHSQPFLSRWSGRLPFVSLQDAHSTEAWWWGDQLGGFTTLFLAENPTWEGWQQALKNNHILSVRHDRVSEWKTQTAGGTPEVRDYILAREKEWRWWNDSGMPSRRLPGSLTVLKPGMAFEAAVPVSGSAVRLRLWADNSTQGVPQNPRAELVSLLIDGKNVKPDIVTAAKDRYFLYPVAAAGTHLATATVRNLENKEEQTLTATWENPA